MSSSPSSRSGALMQEGSGNAIRHRNCESRYLVQHVFRLPARSPAAEPSRRVPCAAPPSEKRYSLCYTRTMHEQTPKPCRQLTVPPDRPLAVATRDGIVVPRMIAGAGEHAARRFLEFFAATIRNKNTRMAYYRAVCSFFSWCDKHRIGEIADIEPLHVAAYVESLGQSMSKPTVKQHLAAVRMLFDWLVVGQILAANPAHAVRGPKHVVNRGKTTVLTAEQARELIDSISLTRIVELRRGVTKEVPCLVGLRDRALIS